MPNENIEKTLKNEHYPTDAKRLTKVYQHQKERHDKNVGLIIKETKDKCKNGNGDEKEKCFRGICRKHAEVLYPKIGELAHAVPAFQIHASKTKKQSLPVTDGRSCSILCNCESESDFRGLSSQRKVGRSFRALNRTFESSTEKCMFIIIDYFTENLMRRFYTKNSKLEEFFKDLRTGKWWVGYPDDPDAEKPARKRSNQDLIVLHEDKGVLFIQVKSVEREEAIEKTIRDGKEQLRQDVLVLNNCLRKSTPARVTKVLALPKLSEQKHDQIKVLVREDVKLLFSDHLSSDDDFIKWWNDLDENRIDLDQIKEIVGRYLGLFSTPCQLQSGNERHHVRDHCDVILFTGRLFKRLIFTQEQVEILEKHDGKNQNVYISGPPGSGKTLMLIQQSKLFLSSSFNWVVVLDAYRGRKGRPVGGFIFANLTSDDSVSKRVEHLPLDITDKNECQSQLTKIKKRLKRRQVMFIIDEMFSHPNWEPILKALRRQRHCFWCAGMDPEFPFKEINCTTERLTSVLRCPPSVNKILLQVDWEKSRKSQASCYKAKSEATERGTQGPIPLCIRHEFHGEYSKHKPIDCPTCAQQLADIFQKKLKLICTDKKSTVRLPCSIVILYNIPRDKYQNAKSNQVEITKTNFDKYKETLSGCQFLDKLTENLQKGIKVRTVLKFEEDFMKEYNWDEILFNWVDTFQGLEKDVVVYLPGDGKIEKSQTGEERPVPGVQTQESGTGKKPQTSTSQHHSQQHVETSDRELRIREKSTSPLSHVYPQVSKHEQKTLEPKTTQQLQTSAVRKHSPTKEVEASDRQLRNRAPDPKPGPSSQPEPQPSTSQERSQSPKPQDRPKTSDHLLRTRKRGPESPSDLQEPKPKQSRSESKIGPQSQASTSQQHSDRENLGVASMTFKNDDIERYSKWDQTNLFLAASRCCAQLIMIVP